MQGKPNVSLQLVFEDRYCVTLQELVLALVNDQPEFADAPVALPPPFTALGTGGFAKELPKVLGQKLQHTMSPPTLVIAVADADRPTNLLATQRAAPGGTTAADDAWIDAFERDWLAHLCERTDIAPHRDRLAVCIIRWSKESILSAATAALLRRKKGAARSVIDRCEPPLDPKRDKDFVTTYRRPDQCMDAVVQSWSQRPYQKSREGDDLAREIANMPEALDEVRRRSPDVVRLVNLIADHARAQRK
jgi:hypothetical protein